MRVDGRAKRCDWVCARGALSGVTGGDLGEVVTASLEGEVSEELRGGGGGGKLKVGDGGEEGEGGEGGLRRGLEFD